MPENNRYDPRSKDESIWEDLWTVLKIISLGVMWLVLMVLTYYSLFTIPIFLLITCAGLLVYRSIRARKQLKPHQYDQEE